jgi:hypothetical protein
VPWLRDRDRVRRKGCFQGLIQQVVEVAPFIGATGGFFVWMSGFFVLVRSRIGAIPICAFGTGAIKGHAALLARGKSLQTTRRRVCRFRD